MSNLEARLREWVRAGPQGSMEMHFHRGDVLEAADILAAIRERIDRYGNGDGTTPIEALNDVNQILGDSK